jgi:hypothetical protein
MSEPTQPAEGPGEGADAAAAGKDATPRAPVVARKAGGSRAGRKKKSGLPALLLFLLFGAAPAAIAGWFFTRPEADQQAMLDRLPDGTGGRALKAGICVAVLFALARLALPAFHGTGQFLRSGLVWFRTRPLGLRILLFPVEFLVYLLWFVVQILFAVDAILIVAASVGVLILVARIVRPDLFESWLPEFLK